ncbi:MAG: diphosphomevalonate/mevalonate 3,5-bisphosphate decarboxylase family protein [Bdellovibrionales bacterium]
MDTLESSAPSNIALIKYMGKKEGNRPTNPSISYTLDKLRSFVSIEETTENLDHWAPLDRGFLINIDSKGQQRFLKFFAFLKKEFSIDGNYLVSSGNNFPSDCGLASSASSFAALTKACFELAKVKNKKILIEKGFLDTEAGPNWEKLSSLSRQGSGSSCRSLFEPWSIWSEEYATDYKCAYQKLHHLAVVVESEKKLVSSSEAHKRIFTSLCNEGREARANTRLDSLKDSLENANWRKAFNICWAEFWDMHCLFETSIPSFGYMNSNTMDVLNQLRLDWDKQNDGPLVTMDAGPNIHLLYRTDQREIFEKHKSEFTNKYRVWGQWE